MPFAVNCITKIGGAWFCPRARNISTMLIYIGIYGAIAAEKFYDMQFGLALIYLAIIASCSVPLTLVMTSSYPEFSPTFSEEEKLNDRKKHSFNLSNQIKDLLKDRNFLLIASSSAIIVIAN